MKYSKIKGHENLIRDEKTKSIINTNINEYENYIKMRNIKQTEVKRIENIENDLNSLKNDINEIKNLLRSALK
jgi:conjugal transfer/entry exclusion protein